MNFCQAEEYERLKEMYLSECDECGCISGHKDMFQGTDPLYHARLILSALLSPVPLVPNNLPVFLYL
mgnify:CR=1 FL=1